MRGIKALIDVAAKHMMQTSELDNPGLEIVIPESYVPYIPDHWNGMLTLAESQNLSKTNLKYCQRMERLTPRERMNRLSSREDLGVGPWDSGIMKLMIKSLDPKTNIDEIAVGNAVPWSCRTRAKLTNSNPTPVMCDHALEYWSEMIPAIGPKLQLIVTFGVVARDVIQRAVKNLKSACQVCPLRFPASIAMNQAASLFTTEDLLSWFPEVEDACRAMSKPVSHFSRGEIVFACHAASMGREHRRRKHDHSTSPG